MLGWAEDLQNMAKEHDRQPPLGALCRVAWWGHLKIVGMARRELPPGFHPQQLMYYIGQEIWNAQCILSGSLAHQHSHLCYDILVISIFLPTIFHQAYEHSGCVRYCPVLTS
jgi:hypothetical protein